VGAIGDGMAELTDVARDGSVRIELSRSPFPVRHSPAAPEEFALELRRNPVDEARFNCPVILIGLNGDRGNREVGVISRELSPAFNR
jgi:hypothetical protein